jgi:hypothetical protein
MKKMVMGIAAVIGLLLVAQAVCAQESVLDGYWASGKKSTLKTDWWFGQGRFVMVDPERGPFLRGTFEDNGKDSALFKADGLKWGSYWKQAWKNKTLEEGWYTPEELAGLLGITVKDVDKTTGDLVTGQKGTYKIKNGVFEMKLGYGKYNNMVKTDREQPEE